MVASLAGHLDRLGVSTRVLALWPSGSRMPESPPFAVPGSHSSKLVQNLGISSSFSFFADLVDSLKETDLVHLHEVWHIPQLCAAITSRVRGIPYVVSPHGALAPWCMGQHRSLKRLAWSSYQKAILNGAGGVHALTPEERGDIRALGVRAAVTVIPNGIDLDLVQDLITPEPHWPRHLVPFLQRFVLYLGRLDKKKGLDILIEAFARIASANDEAALIVAGPDPDRLWPTHLRRISELNLAGRVTYAGFVDEPLKFQLLKRAELLVLPSKSEGMSMTILEALACGTPVVISPGCNLPQVDRARAGRIVPDSSEPLADSILEILGDRPLRALMAVNARQLAKREFSAATIALQMHALYRSLAGRC